jgi:hypothetical protein
MTTSVICRKLAAELQITLHQTPDDVRIEAPKYKELEPETHEFVYSKEEFFHMNELWAYVYEALLWLQKEGLDECSAHAAGKECEWCDGESAGLIDCSCGCGD